MTMIFVLFAAAALAGAYFWWVGRDGWIPGELRRASLVYNETRMSTSSPFPVVGRFDRVYRLGDGLHVPLEYKTRDVLRVYKSDLAQLSLQAWLLRRNGHKTASHGYVAIRERRPGRTKAFRVDLDSDADCESLIQRHVDLLEGRKTPTRVRDGRCRACGHADVC
ncbi:MAG: hypothetical protein B7X93_08895 [Hydrogenophilales bacterium 17-61-9]|nr:MAG: hypothetical protein B7X93_08895 [Hydrogenophilales bacterium 17-61-9]